jgi:predicted nucleic acid-binding protein
MDVLIDTGVLLRLIIPSDPGHLDARRAIKLLRRRGDKLVTLTQNASEFWNVCTRPVTARGGYGLSIEETARRLRLIERLIQVRSDSDEIFREWKRLVVAHSVKGVKAHDARLAAAMIVYGIAQLVTANPADFKRYPEITAITSADVK